MLYFCVVYMSLLLMSCLRLISFVFFYPYRARAYSLLFPVLLCWLCLFSSSLLAQEHTLCSVSINDFEQDVTLNESIEVPLLQFANSLILRCDINQAGVLVVNDRLLRHGSMRIEGSDVGALAANQLTFSLPSGRFVAEIQLDVEQDYLSSVTLQKWPDYALKGQRHNLLLGLFFGLCITLVVYLYFMGRSLKDKRFHHYCYYILCAGMFFLLQEGNLHLFFDATILSTRQVKLLFAGLTVFSGTFFVVSLLDLQGRWPLITRITVLYPAGLVLGISIVLLFMPRGEWFAWLATIMARLTFGLMAFTFGLISCAVYVRVHTARLVLLASCIVLSAMIFRIWLGDVSPFLQRYGLIFSFAVETFLLAIATSERIKGINQDKILAQAQAMTDPLCELLNRRGWENSANKMLKAHQDNGGILCLLYIDLDNFKQINDCYGHQVGDDVLRILAKIIRKQMRDQDAVGRLGGDEFVGLAKFDGEAQSRALEERLTGRLTNINIHTDSGQINVTASVGCVVFSEVQRSVSDMLKQADQAMYKVKQAHHKNPI